MNTQQQQPLITKSTIVAIAILGFATGLLAAAILMKVVGL
jgi:hypothetical protein